MSIDGMIEVLAGFGYLFYVVVLGLSVLLSFGLYIVGALAVWRVLKMLGYDKAWLAWIPFGRYYALAEATMEKDVYLPFNITLAMDVFKWWWLIPILSSAIPIISIAVTVICFGWTLKKIYAMCEGVSPDQVSTIAYISAYIQIIMWIKFFTYKSVASGYQTYQAQPQYANQGYQQQDVPQDDSYTEF